MAQSDAFRAIAISQFSRDPAVTETTVTLDTSKWSTRKKNIVLNAIETGVAACGVETGYLIREMMQALGSDIQQVTKWSNTIDATMVKPEMLEDLTAYTCAWIKMTLPPEDSTYHRYGNHWRERHFVEAVDNGHSPTQIPLPHHLTDTQKREFATTYLRDPSETDRIARDTLLAKVSNGETIQLSFT